jgi:hypothetical protein
MIFLPGKTIEDKLNDVRNRWMSAVVNERFRHGKEGYEHRHRLVAIEQHLAEEQLELLYSYERDLQ